MRPTQQGPRGGAGIGMGSGVWGASGAKERSIRGRREGRREEGRGQYSGHSTAAAKAGGREAGGASEAAEHCTRGRGGRQRGGGRQGMEAGRAHDRKRSEKVLRSSASSPSSQQRLRGSVGGQGREGGGEVRLG